jgi:hypothetical protein
VLQFIKEAATPGPVDPTSGAPSTSGAALDVEAQRLADHAFVREIMPPGWAGNPDDVIAAFQKHGERSLHSA